MSIVKSCSLTKNLIKLTDLPPKPVVTWDMHERIKRNKEIWGNPDSIVHRLPKHYQEVENLINNERNDVAFLRDIGRILYFHEKSQFIMIHRSFAFIGTQRGMYNWKRRFHTFFLSRQQIHLPPGISNTTRVLSRTGSGPLGW
jgi:hypothetical protein